MPSDSAVVTAVKHQLAGHGWVELPSHGYSMYPFIRQGCICRFAPVTDPIKAGEVLLFLSVSGTLVTHRLHRMEERESAAVYVCRGDSNLSFDAPVSREHIIGKLVVIRSKRLRITSGGWIAAIWKRIMLRYPFVTRCIHYYLGWKRKRSHETI